MQNAKIGLIGLAVMGANLARNLASKNIPVLVFNRTAAKTDEFMKNSWCRIWNGPGRSF